MTLIKNYIDGNKTAISSDSIPVNDPSTGEIISQVVASEAINFPFCILSILD